MTSLFHGGLYKETLRRLRTPALFMLVLATVFDAFPLIMRAARFSDYAYWIGTYRFDAIHYSLYTIPFIVVPILMLVTFRYQHRRTGSDFYFSLPLSKATLTVTQLAAVLTWTAIIIVGSSVIVALLCLLPVNGRIYNFNILDVLRPVGASLSASLFAASVFSLAVSLCGTTVNTLIAASLILFAPRILLYVLNMLVLWMAPILPSQSTTAVLDVIMGNLLYGGHDNLLVWISTLVKAALITTLAVWAASKRPAEMAGRAAVHPALHIAFRTLVGTLLLLPAVITILMNDMPFGLSSRTVLSGVIFEYLVALVGYYLYELITTRKAKNLWKATLWLPLLAAVHLAMIGGCMLTTHIVNHTVCTPETVQRVELKAVVLRQDTETRMSESGYTVYANTWFEGLAVMSEAPKNSFYYRTSQYASSEAPNTSLTDEDSRRLVCEALERTLDYHNGPRSENSGYPLDYLRNEAKKDGSRYTYNIDVVLHDGWITRSRRIGVTQKELELLLDELDEQEALPDYFTNILR